MADRELTARTSSTRVRCVIGRIGRTLTLAGALAALSGFGAVLAVFGSGDVSARLLMGLISLFLLAVAAIIVLTDSVFVGECRVRPGRWRGWTPLTSAADLSVVARRANVVCLMVGRGEAARVLLTSTSAFGVTQEGLLEAVGAARRRVLKAAGISDDQIGA